ncbi:MAG: hypothetical protein DRO13_03700 [Thermoprotei archaeon]|nr:MAG: hypothetical protein DRO13_03700 [Thermoprotei archaeon]
MNILRRAVSNLVALAIVTSILASAGIYLLAKVAESYGIVRSAIETDSKQPLAIARCWNISGAWICAVKALNIVNGSLRVVTSLGNTIEIGSLQLDPGDVRVFKLYLRDNESPRALMVSTGRLVYVYPIGR